MTPTGIIGIIISGLVLLSAWVSPRLFRIFILILSFLLGAVVVTSITIWLWTLDHPVFALPLLSIAALGGFLLLHKRRAVIFWAIATFYLILAFPFPRASPLLLGVPGGIMTLLVARRVIENFRTPKTTGGKAALIGVLLMLGFTVVLLYCGFTS